MNKEELEYFDIFFAKSIDTLHHWHESFFHLLPHILVAIVSLIIFAFIGKKAKKKIKKPLRNILKGNSSSKLWVNLISNLVLFAFIAIGVIIASSILGLDKIFLSALTGLSFLGLMLVYALKDVAANFFAGLVLNLREPFKKGDMVVINGHRGYILSIDVLFTTIRTPDNQVIFFPNHVVYAGEIVNYMSLPHRRVVLKTGVSYGDDLELAKKIAIDAIQSMDVVLKDMPVQLYFTEIGNSSYNFELRFWIEFKTQVQYREAKSRCIDAVKRAYDANGICIPYSVSTLDFGVKGGVNIFDQGVQVNNIEDSTE